MKLYHFGTNITLSEIINHYINDGLLLINSKGDFPNKYLKIFTEILSNNSDCLMISNHINWSKGWTLINLNNLNNYTKYLKYIDNTLQQKSLDWLLIQPVNGLANRLRFLISCLSLGYNLKKRCLLNWKISQGFDSTKFEQLFQTQITNLNIIPDFQFEILAQYSFSIDKYIPGIINGLEQQGYQTNIQPKVFQQYNILSIVGSNDLRYVFQYHQQFNQLKQSIDKINPIFWRQLKILKQYQSFLNNKIDSKITYGIHIRRGENLIFNQSKTCYFIDIIHQILKSEPLAKFLIVSNCHLTIEYIQQKIYHQNIIIRKQPSLEQSNWFYSYLNSFRPEGSSIQALYDLYLLSKCKKIFGTNDSSFSMVASQWGDIPLDIIRDFNIHNNYHHFIKGWSMVTCCMNRQENLLANIGSWLNCHWLDEIIIIDWSSDQPVNNVLNINGFDQHPNFSKIRIYRVEHQSKWVLTWAFNLAIALTKYQNIIKIDCDIYLKSNFLTINNNFEMINQGCFYTGNWEQSHQIHLNGQMVINRNDFFLVNGYNEFIINYGYDDTDLYQRLIQKGLTKLNLIDHEISGDHVIYHREHNDNDRIKYQLTDNKTISQLIEENRILSTKHQWSKSTSRHHYLIKGSTIYLV